MSCGRPQERGAPATTVEMLSEAGHAVGDKTEAPRPEDSSVWDGALTRLARMRHRFRNSMHLSCEPHGFRRSGRLLRVDWRDRLSLWRCAGWWLALSGSHLYGIYGLRACDGLGVAPIAGSDGCRSPSGYPDEFHNGAFCKFASTSVKVLAYGYACENDSHIRRAVILTRAPIFNSFSRSVAHWARVAPRRHTPLSY